MRPILFALAVLSLAACLASGIAHFVGRLTYTQYTTVVVSFSIVYFIAATVWVGARKNKAN